MAKQKLYYIIFLYGTELACQYSVVYAGTLDEARMLALEKYGRRLVYDVLTAYKFERDFAFFKVNGFTQKDILNGSTYSEKAR